MENSSSDMRRFLSLESPSMVKMQTFMAFKSMGKILAQAEIEKAKNSGMQINQDVDQSSYYASFDRDRFMAYPIIDLQIGPIDKVGVCDIYISPDEGGVIDVGLELYSDGSPFVFDTDIIDDKGGVNLYELFLMPELPPFLVQTNKIDKAGSEHLTYKEMVTIHLEQVLKGEQNPPYFLTDEDCQSLLEGLATSQPKLIDSLKLDNDKFSD